MNRYAAAIISFALAGLPAGVADNLSISADQTLVEDGGDRKILRGDVVIEFGEFSFKADEVIQHFEQGEPFKYEASGSPVRVTQSGGAMAGLEEGIAETLIYLVEERTLLLTNYELRLSGGMVQKGKEFKMVFP